MTLRSDIGWFGPILRDHATVEQDWTLRWWQRWGYTAKALVVLLLQWDTLPKERDSETIEVAGAGFHRTYHPDFGEGGAWEAFVVGRGVLRGWWFTVSSVGWP